MAALACGSCVFLVGFRSSVPAVPANAVAVVGHDVITRDELSAAMKAVETLGVLEGEKPPKQGTSAYRSFEVQEVADLVNQAMYEQEAARMGVGVTPKVVAASLAKIRKQKFSGSEKKMRAEMKIDGLSQAELDREEIVNLTEANVERELDSKLTITRRAEMAYYKAHESSYTTNGKLASFADARAAIEGTLLQMKESAVLSAWEKHAAASFCAAGVAYGTGFRPPPSDDPCSARATGR